MRKIHILLIFSIFFFLKANAQTLEWLNVFDTHSAGFGVGLNPNSLIDNNGKITTTVIENDTLKLYQTQEDGTITNSYIIQKNIKENHTPLIRISENGLALEIGRASCRERVESSAGAVAGR